MGSIPVIKKAVWIYLLLCITVLSTGEAATLSPYFGGGNLTPMTPFDRRLAATGFFEIGASPLLYREERPSLARLFFIAQRFRYVSDRHGDHWQTPRETEQKRSGDCEDKALWLYKKLVESGYQNVHLMIGKYRSFERKYHVWIEYTDLEGTTYLLDPSTQKRVWSKDRFSSGFYLPYYSFSNGLRYRY